MHIGEFINNYLKERNLSQRQFAKQCDLSNGYISMLINNVNPKTGKPLVPSLTALLSISKGMGISLDELINNTDDIDVDISAAKNIYKPASSNIHFINHLTPDEIKLIAVYRNNPDIRAKIQAFLEVCGEPLTSPPSRTIKIAAYGGGVMDHEITATDEEIKEALEESEDDQFIVKKKDW